MMNLVVNKIRILWLLLNLFGFLQSQAQQFYWIPYEVETAQTKFNPGYATLQENSGKSSQNSLNPSRNLHSNYYNDFASNSGQYNQDPNNYNYNSYHPRETELDKESYYNYYVNDKSYKARKSWEQKENAPQLYFHELGDLKVQSRKTVNNTSIKKPDVVVKSSLNGNIASGKLSREEIKRTARQTQKQRPGFFWTLFRVAFETVNDTRSAIGQISELLNNGIAPDPTTQKPGASGMIVQTTTVKSDITTNNSTTSTAAPFVLTRSGLQGIIRRNVKGLVRLFNIEWKDALNQSQITTREFQRDLGNSIGSFLRDNPDAY